MPNHAPHVLPGSSLRTMATILRTTIPSKIASSAHWVNTVRRVPPFVIGVPRVADHLKIKLPTKLVVHRARVDGTKHKRVKNSATIAAVENTNLKTVLLFVCPATLGCINRRRGNRAAPNAQKIITPINPNKRHAKRAATTKPLFKALHFVSNAMRVDSCPPRKHARGAHWAK
jgi:hypothetical protein